MDRWYSVIVLCLYVDDGYGGIKFCLNLSNLEGLYHLAERHLRYVSFSRSVSEYPEYWLKNLYHPAF